MERIAALKVEAQQCRDTAEAAHVSARFAVAHGFYANARAALGVAMQQSRRARKLEELVTKLECPDPEPRPWWSYFK